MVLVAIKVTKVLLVLANVVVMVTVQVTARDINEVL